jgi:enolase
MKKGKKMDIVEQIIARQIYDSRGFPTIEAVVLLESGATGRASVPSGASTGKKEALELRDGIKEEHHGKGVTKAIANIIDFIEPELIGYDVMDQEKIDMRMIELDGTSNKEKLGANAILAVSLACAKAAANSLKIPLYRYLGGKQAGIMPIPMLNVINGGKHADNNIDVQEFMIVPHGLPTFAKALRAGSEIYMTLKEILHHKKMATAVGDEGGFAPDLKSNREAIEILVEAISKAGYKPGIDVSIALDSAASSFYKNQKYHLSDEGEIDGKKLMDYYAKMIQDFPIYSLEDPFDEDDSETWIEFTKRFGKKIPIIGDDNFVTNYALLKKGIEEGIANSVLIKVNQIGTLTETMKTIRLAQLNNYGYVISHRSGETEDSFIADLAVAMSGGHIKTGAPCRSERLAKYNQLLRIEEDMQEACIFGRKLLSTSI